VAGTDDNDSTFDDKWATFRLLCDEYAFFVELTKSEKLAAKLVRRFLEDGERDRDGRLRYRIYEIEALPGGITPSPYDGSFWCSDPDRGIHCEIDCTNSSARWTGPASAEWQTFNGRRTAEYNVTMIRLSHGAVLDFLQGVGLLPQPPAQPSELLAQSAPQSPAEQPSSPTPLEEARPQELVRLPEEPQQEQPSLKTEPEPMSMQQQAPKQWQRSEAKIWLAEKVAQYPPPKERRQKMTWCRVRHGEMQTDFGDEIPWSDPDSLRRRLDDLLRESGNQPGKKV
jgi:hypothetical protein